MEPFIYEAILADFHNNMEDEVQKGFETRSIEYTQIKK